SSITFLVRTTGWGQLKPRAWMVLAISELLSLAAGVNLSCGAKPFFLCPTWLLPDRREKIEGFATSNFIRVALISPITIGYI
ncbi:MAG: hypothetical protein PHG75_04460, partial [Syntrophomonas sp.]|nr:hypothetical protein [Syntrophomonas sp.]